MTHTPTPQEHPPFWTRDFTLWWLGTTQSSIGTALAGVALAYLVLDTTGSSGQMGINLALTLLPSLLSPLFGTLTDRINPKLPLIVLNLLSGAAQLLVGLIALHGPVGTEVLHGLALFNGLIAAVYVPASMGVTPRLVPPPHRARAAGLMQAGTSAARLLGLVGGGALVGLVGSAPSLIMDGASFLLFAVLLCFVRLPDHAPRHEPSSFWMDFRSGVQYTRRSAALRLLPLQAFCINAALAPMEMLLPARMQALGVGAGGFGLFLGLLTAGMTSASLALAWLGPRINFRPAGLAGFVVTGALFLLLALATRPAQMYVLAFLCGAALATLNVSLSLLFQTLVHPEYYGRVGSLLNTFGGIGAPITLLALAPIADEVPLQVIFVAGGVVLLVAAVAWTTVLGRLTDQVIKPPDPPHHLVGSHDSAR